MGRGVFGVLGIREGEGWGEGGSRGVSLQATWKRGGRILSQQGGFQVSEKGPKGEQRGTKGKARGVVKGDKSKGNVPCIVYTVIRAMYIRNVWNV